jgi:hypothetical protein
MDSGSSYALPHAVHLLCLLVGLLLDNSYTSSQLMSSHLLRPLLLLLLLSAPGGTCHAPGLCGSHGL